MRSMLIQRPKVFARLGGAVRAGRFARDEKGAVTVEMVLWLPFIFGLIMLITDVSLAFFGRAQAYRVVQDLNRVVSLGLVSDETKARDMLLASFEGVSPNASATVTVENGFVSTIMTIPASDLIMFSGPLLLRSFADVTMTVGAQHYVEWPT